MSVPWYDSGFVLLTKPSTRSLCGVVKTSSVGMLALQTTPFLARLAAAVPLVIVGETDPQIRAGTAEVERGVVFRVQQLRAGTQGRVVNVPGPDRIVEVGARSREDRVPQFGDRHILRNVWKHRLRPGRRRGRNDRPVDVESDDQVESWPVGLGAGAIGARYLVRILVGEKRRVVADDGEARGTVLVGGRHAVVEPTGRGVERIVLRMLKAQKRRFLV